MQAASAPNYATPAVEPAFAPQAPDEFVDAMVSLFEFLTGPQRTVTAARLALYVEAGHDPALSQALAGGRTTLEARLRPALVALGAPDPDLALQLIATTFEGLFLHAVARHADLDARRFLDAVVRTALGG